MKVCIELQESGVWNIEKRLHLLVTENATLRMAREGIGMKECAKNLGISLATLYRSRSAFSQESEIELRKLWLIEIGRPKGSKCKK